MPLKPKTEKAPSGKTVAAAQLATLRRETMAEWAAKDAADRAETARLLSKNKPAGAEAAFMAHAALAGLPRLPLAQGKRLAAHALKELEKIAGRRPSARRFLRDLHNSVGNFLAHWNATDAAFTHYETAARGERDYTRLALARLNMAKLYMTTGRPHEGLDLLRRLDAARVEDPRIAISIRLNACRAYLLFGYVDSANGIMAQFRGQLPGPPLDLEYKYLSLMARASVAHPERFATRLADFVASGVAARHGAEPLYEMEAILFRLVADRSAIRNRERAMIRAAYLKKRTGMTRLYRLIRLLDSALSRRGLPATRRTDLLQVTRSLLGSDHALSVRISLMWACQRLIHMGRYAVATDLHDVVSEHAGYLLGPLLLRRSSLPKDNRIVEDLERLGTLFPRHQTPALKGFAWLVRTY